MKQLQFENYEEFACDISDTFDNLDDEYGDVSIIAKYDEAKEIIKELLCIGYDVASIELNREDFAEYWDEYLISLNFDGVWCEKFRGDTGYFTDESTVTYIMDNCSSNVIPYCKSKNVYDVSVGDFDDEESEAEQPYMINFEPVDKETFDKYASKFAPDLVNTEDEAPDNDNYSIIVKCNLDAYDTLEIIKDMEYRMMHMNDMFREMNYFRQLLNW